MCTHDYRLDGGFVPYNLREKPTYHVYCTICGEKTILDKPPEGEKEVAKEIVKLAILRNSLRGKVYG